jgi:hypothetical protein
VETLDRLAGVFVRLLGWGLLALLLWLSVVWSIEEPRRGGK